MGSGHSYKKIVNSNTERYFIRIILFILLILLNYPHLSYADINLTCPTEEEIYKRISKGVAELIYKTRIEPYNAVFNYTWYKSPYILSSLLMWESTKKSKYVELICDFYQYYNNETVKGTNFFDEARGSKIKTWHSISKGVYKTAPSWTAMMVYPALRLINSGALKGVDEACKTKLKKIADSAYSQLSEYDKEYIEINNEKGFYYNPFSKYVEPHNRQVAILLALAEIYDYTKDSIIKNKIKTKIKHIINWILSDFITKSKDNKTFFYEWTYVKGYEELGLKGDKSPGEPVVKGWLTLQLLKDRSSLQLWKGLNLNKLANTFLYVLKRKDGSYRFRTSLSSPQLLSSSQYDYLLMWDYLGDINNRVRQELELFVNTNMDIFTDGWLTGPIGTLAIANRYFTGTCVNSDTDIVTINTDLPLIRKVIPLDSNSFLAYTADNRLLKIHLSGKVKELTKVSGSIYSMFKSKKFYILGTTSGHLYKLSKKFGIIAHLQINNTPIWDIASIDDINYVIATDKGIYKTDFNHIQKIELGIKDKVWSLKVNNDTLFLTGADKVLIAYNLIKEKIKWKRKGVTEGRALLIKDNKIYLVGQDGRVYITSLSGKEFKTVHFKKEYPTMSLSEIDKYLLIGDLRGNLRVIDTSKTVLHNEITFPSGILSITKTSRNRIIISRIGGYIDIIKYRALLEKK